MIALAVLTLSLASGCVALETQDVAPGEPSRGAPSVVRGVVTKHTDGDTMHVRLGGVDEIVRFIGIDAPEVGRAPEPFGEEASRLAAELAPLGNDVWIETDAELRDRYGRLLAYVWLDEPETGDTAEVRESMLNALMVRNGYAHARTYPPNVAYQDVLRACEADARAEGSGLWAGGGPDGR